MGKRSHEKNGTKAKLFTILNKTHAQKVNKYIYTNKFPIDTIMSHYNLQTRG